jgi:hypothetical protein
MAAHDFTAHRRAARALALAATGAGWIALAALAGCIPTAPNLAPGAESLPCTGPGCVPLAGGAPVTTAPLVDCEAAIAGLQFAPFTVLDNENAALGAPGVAEYFYQYVDGTAGLNPSGYSPPSILADRCKDNSPIAPHPPGSNYVLHTSGGPFTGWGGGIGMALEHLAQDSSFCTSPAPSVVCPAAGGFTTSTPCYCPLAGADNASQQIAFAALDVSQWDGISLWARRGPNGQPLLRVLVGDKYTDDDISYLMYVGQPTDPPSKRFCERKAECSCLYQDTTCSFYSANPAIDPIYGNLITPDPNNPDPSDPTNAMSNGALFCGPPGSHPASASQNTFSTNGTNCVDSAHCSDNFCGNSLCDQPYAAYATNGPDLQFVNRACTPYTYRNGVQANICYNPGKDPTPPEADEQCGDHFAFPLNLSTDWQFYKIPFTEMFQQGWAKQAPNFDLTSISVVRFTWDVGYIDYYIDDVKFYREARSADAATP